MISAGHEVSGEGYEHAAPAHDILFGCSQRIEKTRASSLPPTPDPSGGSCTIDGLLVLKV